MMSKLLRNLTVLFGLSLSIIVAEDNLYPANSLNNVGSLYYLGNNIITSRFHHTMSFLDPYLIVYGGMTSRGIYLDDINMYDIRYQQWSGTISRKRCCTIHGETVETLGQESNLDVTNLRIGYEGGLPAARAEHASTSSDKLIFIFGGITDFGYMNDIFTFDPFYLKWKSIVRASGSWPSRRAGHVMHYYEGDKIVLFGGRGINVNSGLLHNFNDIWIYDIMTNSWESIPVTSNTISKHPSGREHVASCVYANRLWIFGGMSSTTHLTYNDLWSFNLISYHWEIHSPNSGAGVGFIPPPLHHAHLLPTEYADSPGTTGLLIYGGVGGGGSCGGTKCNATHAVIGQLYRYDTDIAEWTPHKLFHSSSAEVDKYVSDTRWKYARLSSSNDSSVGGSGKLQKDYVLESIAVATERKLIFEFGGFRNILPEDNVTVDGNMRYGQGRNYYDASGGQLLNGPWDTYTGEQLREVNDILISSNSLFMYLDVSGDTNVDNDSNSVSVTDISFFDEKVEFIRQFSQYSLGINDVVQLSKTSMIY